MSGLPLQVGDLPPGTVAIRVVRDPFANVTSQTVELHVGQGGRVLSSVTGADGRAIFEGLAVGDEVYGVATVEGELLQTQRFALPAQGGVRVLLVAGIGAGSAPGTEPPLMPLANAGGGGGLSVPVPPAPVGAAPTSAAPSSRATSSRTTVVAMLVMFGLVGGGVVYSASRRKKPASAAEPVSTTIPSPASSTSADGATPADRREELFAELISLERAFAAGGVDPTVRATRRESLLVAIEAIDARLDRHEA
ncbi:MAG: hypothetical protein U0Q12_20970 [Vicinamibacterales bacterium]